VGTAYSQVFTVSGGVPPFTWTLVSGTQELKMSTVNNTGVLSGTPVTSGSFQLGMRVQDSAGQANGTVLAWTVNPAPPTMSITVTQPTALIDQPVPRASLGQPYPAALNATYRLTFTPSTAMPADYNNNDVQFVTGGNMSPSVAFPANSTASVTLPAVQLGSVWGTITVQLASLTMAGTGQNVPLPSPVPSVAITVPRLAPIITPGSVKIIDITSSSFQVVLDASSTPRDLTSGAFVFTAASGTQLNGCTPNCTVQFSNDAATWFSSSNGVANGGAFSLTVPFTFSGDTSVIGTVSVTLTNSAGTSAAVAGGK